MSTRKDTAGPPALAQHSIHTLPPPARQRLAPSHPLCSLSYSRRDLHLVWLKPKLICKTGKSKWFSPIRRQGYGKAQSEAAQQMMFSTENSFLLDSPLYLAEKHSKDICWSSSPTQQSLRTKVALFKQGAHHSLQIKVKKHCSRLFLSSAATQQSSVLDPRPPIALEQNEWSGVFVWHPPQVLLFPPRPISATERKQNQGCLRQSNSRCSRNELIYIWTKAKANGRLNTTSLKEFIWRQSWKERCQNGTFHCISWNWKMSQSQQI